MMLPGGDGLLDRGTAIVFEYWQKKFAAMYPGHKPQAWADADQRTRDAWLTPQRAFAELVIMTLIEDQALAVADYDGIIGAAIERAVRRYALEELGYPADTVPPQ